MRHYFALTLFLFLGLAAGACSLRAEEDVELTFVFGSEKKEWLKKCNEIFEKNSRHIVAGKRVHITVKLMPMGSGECYEKASTGQVQADLVSPASHAFFELGDYEGKKKDAAYQPLVESSVSLVKSPVVLAMWKPAAEKLGWSREKNISWKQIFDLGCKGWSAIGKEDRPFKFGHTHPEFSTSGLLTIIIESFIASGKTSNLTLVDINRPETGEYLKCIEQSILEYGESTGFYRDQILKYGESYVDAAVLYENLIIEANQNKAKYHMTNPLVAIYPTEGTLMTDHPCGIVDRKWVTPERREAAAIYLAFLLEKEQQGEAIKLGFRPGNPKYFDALPLPEALFSEENGVSITLPRNFLNVPDQPQVVDAIVQLWKKNKKVANIAVLLDVSGSMNDDNKLVQALGGLQTLLDTLQDEDNVSLMTFNHETDWVEKNVKLKDGRAALKKRVAGIKADGGTALYQAIERGLTFMRTDPPKDKINAIVVLTDGTDSMHTMSLKDICETIKGKPGDLPVRMYTIKYGNDASSDIMKKLAESAQGKAVDGDQNNVKKLFSEIQVMY